MTSSVRQARQVWRLSYHIDKINNLEKNSKMEDEVYEKKKKKKERHVRVNGMIGKTRINVSFSFEFYFNLRNFSRTIVLVYFLL